MIHLTVLYDERCGLCRGARRWLEEQPQYVELRFLALGSEAARRRFPDLDHDATERELAAIDDRGGVYKGAKAWLMCLWSLRQHRLRAIRWSSPTLLPYARTFFDKLSKSRHRLGS